MRVITPLGLLLRPAARIEQQPLHRVPGLPQWRPRCGGQQHCARDSPNLHRQLRPSWDTLSSETRGDTPERLRRGSHPSPPTHKSVEKSQEEWRDGTAIELRFVEQTPIPSWWPWSCSRALEHPKAQGPGCACADSFFIAIFLRFFRLRERGGDAEALATRTVLRSDKRAPLGSCASTGHAALGR